MSEIEKALEDLRRFRDDILSGQFTIYRGHDGQNVTEELGKELDHEVKSIESELKRLGKP